MGLLASGGDSGEGASDSPPPPAGPPGGAVPGEEVLRRAGERHVHLVAELAAVDHVLGMLDAHAHGERLGLQGHAVGSQPLEEWARAMARGQHHGIEGLGDAVHDDAGGPSPGDDDVLHRGAEAEPAAQGLAAFAQGLDDELQLVGADMGMRQVGDGGIGAAGDQVRQEGVGVRRAGPAGELAVREGAGPALAEEDVAAGIEVVALQEPADVLEAAAHVAALLEDRPPGSLCAAAPAPPPYRPARCRSRRRDCRRGGNGVALRPLPKMRPPATAGDGPGPAGGGAAETRGCLSSAVEAEFDGVAPQGMVVAPGIEGLAEDTHRAHPAALDAEEKGDLLGQIGIAPGDGQSELPEHIGSEVGLGGGGWGLHVSPGGRTGPQWMMGARLGVPMAAAFAGLRKQDNEPGGQLQRPAKLSARSCSDAPGSEGGWRSFSDGRESSS